MAGVEHNGAIGQRRGWDVALAEHREVRSDLLCEHFNRSRGKTSAAITLGWSTTKSSIYYTIKESGGLKLA
jgi:hypothetical protein